MLLLVCQANEFSKTGCTIMDSMSHFIAASLRGVGEHTGYYLASTVQVSESNTDSF